MSSTLELQNLYSQAGGNEAIWVKNILEGTATNKRVPLPYFWAFMDLFPGWTHAFKYNAWYTIETYGWTTGLTSNGLIVIGGASNGGSTRAKDYKRRIIVYEKNKDGLKKLKYSWYYAAQIQQHLTMYSVPTTVPSGKLGEFTFLVTSDFADLQTNRFATGKVTKDNDGDPSLNPPSIPSHVDDSLSYQTFEDAHIDLSLKVSQTNVNEKNLLLDAAESDRYSYIWRTNWTAICDESRGSGSKSDSAQAYIIPYNRTTAQPTERAYWRFDKITLPVVPIFKYDGVSGVTDPDNPMVNDADADLSTLYYGHMLDEYPTKLYEGLPLTVSEKKGMITIDGASFTSSSNNIRFSITDSPFPNSTNLVASITLEANPNYSRSGNYYKMSASYVSGTPFQIKFNNADATKKVYYIKIQDGNGASAVTFKINGSIQQKIED